MKHYARVNAFPVLVMEHGLTNDFPFETDFESMEFISHLLLVCWHEQIDLSKTPGHNPRVLPPAIQLDTRQPQSIIDFELSDQYCWHVNNGRVRHHSPFTDPCILRIAFSDQLDDILPTIPCCNHEPYHLSLEAVKDLMIALKNYQLDILIAERTKDREISYRNLIRAVLTYLRQKNLVREFESGNVLTRSPHPFHYELKYTVDVFISYLYRWPHDFDLPSNLNVSHRFQLRHDLQRCDSTNAPFVKLAKHHIGLTDGLLNIKTHQFTSFQDLQTQMIMADKTFDVSHFAFQTIETPQFDSFLFTQFPDDHEAMNRFLFALGQTLLPFDMNDPLSVCFNISVPELNGRHHTIIHKLLQTIHRIDGVNRTFGEIKQFKEQSYTVNLIAVNVFKITNPSLQAAVSNDRHTPCLFVSRRNETGQSGNTSQVITIPLQHTIQTSSDDWPLAEAPGIMKKVLQVYGRRNDPSFITNLLEKVDKRYIHDLYLQLLDRFRC